jgi:hypothetical protein
VPILISAGASAANAAPAKAKLAASAAPVILSIHFSRSFYFRLAAIYRDVAKTYSGSALHSWQAGMGGMRAS